MQFLQPSSWSCAIHFGCIADSACVSMRSSSNGSIDMSEFTASAKSSEEAAALPMLFYFLDSPDSSGNGDGNLSLEEWLVGMEKVGFPRNPSHCRNPPVSGCRT